MSIKKERIYRIFGKILFLLYIVFLIYFLFLAEWYGRTEVTEEYRYNLELFKEIRRFLTYREQLGMFTVLANLLGNIMIFVPYGFFISMAGKSMGFFKILFFSMALSLGVETIQLFTRVGSFDVDDILLNTIGGVLGYILFVVCSRIRRKRYVRKHKKPKQKQAGNGNLSCLFGLGSAAVLAGCIAYAFVRRGEAPGIIGGITIISLILAGYGIYSAIIGFRERERSYLTCKIGIVMNAAAIISFFAVFIRGLN